MFTSALHISRHWNLHWKKATTLSLQALLFVCLFVGLFVCKNTEYYWIFLLLLVYVDADFGDHWCVNACRCWCWLYCEQYMHIYKYVHFSTCISLNMVLFNFCCFFYCFFFLLQMLFYAIFIAIFYAPSLLFHSSSIFVPRSVAPLRTQSIYKNIYVPFGCWDKYARIKTCVQTLKVIWAQADSTTTIGGTAG